MLGPISTCAKAITEGKLNVILSRREKQFVVVRNLFIEIRRSDQLWYICNMSFCHTEVYERLFSWSLKTLSEVHHFFSMFKPSTMIAVLIVLIFLSV